MKMKKLPLLIAFGLSSIISSNSFAQDAGTGDRKGPGAWVENLKCTGVHHETGTVVEYKYYVSRGAKVEDNAVYVFLETGGDKDFRDMLDRVTSSQVIPEGLFLFVSSGSLPATIDGGKNRGMRLEEFDQNDSPFADFLIEDLIPEASSLAGVGISTNPDMHFISGGSSGGLMAWNALWYRNDYFRRGYLSSPNYFFGDSFHVAIAAAGSMDFTGIDTKFDVFANGGHGYGFNKPEFWEKMFSWVFAEKEVKVKSHSKRYNTICPEGSHWEQTAAPVPARMTSVQNRHGRYYIKDGSLWFKPEKGKKLKFDGIGRVTSVSFSSDLWRLYVTSADRRFIFAYTLGEDGVPGYRYKLVPIHLPHDCTTLGCEDMAVSDEDRVFVATELGVQTTPSAGTTDLILPLPDDKPAVRVWLSDGRLFASSADGKVYSRTVNARPHDGKTASRPSSQSYADGLEGYISTHFKELFETLPEGTTVESVKVLAE